MSYFIIQFIFSTADCALALDRYSLLILQNESRTYSFPETLAKRQTGSKDWERYNSGFISSSIAMPLRESERERGTKREREEDRTNTEYAMRTRFSRRADAVSQKYWDELYNKSFVRVYDTCSTVQQKRKKERERGALRSSPPRLGIRPADVHDPMAFDLW